MLKPGDRRYLYPFTNCTNCGPRFTIVEKLPYDRPFTTMRRFKMCSACKTEYSNPLDRRFHAQPDACPVCGPSLRAQVRGKALSGLHVLELAAEVILKGEIAAIQSLGGFHLACLASSAKAVARLRELKDRPHKPFAVMVSSAAAASAICRISQEERMQLGSHRAPVVMLAKKRADLLNGAAPGLARAGVMLAYTPLHAALFEMLRRRGFDGPLIMTSGNRRDEPIAKSPQEALTKLKGLVDVIISHDRPIHNRIDDSVVFVCKGEPRLVRRARGFVPEAVKLEGSFSGSVLAGSFKGIKVPVQHHAAHILSVAAERGLDEPFIGAAFDGTGYGLDGRIWGGEFLVFEGKTWRRAGHLKYFRLPGGEAAVHEIWRAAFSLLTSAAGPGFDRRNSGIFRSVPPKNRQALARMLERRFNSPETSSVGRLFDAIGCLAGLRDRVSYEGQAPMELESLFARPRGDFYPFPLIKENGMLVMDPSRAVLGAFADRGKAKLISERFHCGLAAAAVKALKSISCETGIGTVCLSGGVFQNRVLLELVIDGLERSGLKVFSNSLVPANDGGISLGQVWSVLKGFTPQKIP